MVLRTTFLHGKASHTILRSLALPYESCSLTTPQASGTIKVPQTSNLNSSRSMHPASIARKGIRHTVRLTSDDGRGTPPLRHFEWSEAESRNPPALRSLPLLSGKAILLHFCLIFCHLISIVYILSSNFWRLTSLYPQISDPLGTSYRLSLKRGACHWIFSCCYLTISPLSDTISVPIPSCRRWYKKVDFPLIHGTMMSEERGIMFNKKETRRIESL